VTTKSRVEIIFKNVTFYDHFKLYIYLIF